MSGERSRELAINDPFESPELARLITLTRRALRNRQVLTPTTMSAEDFAALKVALLAQNKPDAQVGLER